MVSKETTSLILDENKENFVIRITVMELTERIN